MEITNLVVAGFSQPSVSRALIEYPGNTEKGFSQRFSCHHIHTLTNWSLSTKVLQSKLLMKIFFICTGAKTL